MCRTLVYIGGISREGNGVEASDLFHDSASSFLMLCIGHWL